MVIQLFTLAGTLLNLALTLPAAYALSRRFGWRVKFYVFLVFTMYFSGSMIPTYLIVKGLGLYDTRTVMLLISAVSTYNPDHCPYFFANGVPHEIEEAARIDGASQARTFSLLSCRYPRR